MDTAIRTGNSSAKVVGELGVKRNVGTVAQKKKPKLKLGFRMGDTVILLALRKAAV